MCTYIEDMKNIFKSPSTEIFHLIGPLLRDDSAVLQCRNFPDISQPTLSVSTAVALQHDSALARPGPVQYNLLFSPQK